MWPKTKMKTKALESLDLMPEKKMVIRKLSNNGDTFSRT